MRHRSVAAFILLLATFGAVPQASEQLLALKDTVSARVRAEIWSAFLRLHTGPFEERLAKSGATEQASAAQQATVNGARVASKAKKTIDAFGGQEPGLKMAASHNQPLGEPALPLIASFDVSDEEQRHLQQKQNAQRFVIKGVEEKVLPAQKMSMLIPPSDNIGDVRIAEIAFRPGFAEIEARQHALKDAEMSREMVHVAAHMERGGRRMINNPDEVRRAIDAAMRAGEGKEAKVLRLLERQKVSVRPDRLPRSRKVEFLTKVNGALACATLATASE